VTDDIIYGVKNLKSS